MGAEITRTSIGIDCVAPTGRTSPSCSTRRTSLQRQRMSPISSRKIVPPSAAWNSPCAPARRENAPRAWPNSSDSSSGSGMAPQLTQRRDCPGAGWRGGSLARAVPCRSPNRVDQHARVGVGDELGCRSSPPSGDCADDAGSPLAGRFAPVSGSSPAFQRRCDLLQKSWLSKGLVRKPTRRWVADTASGMCLRVR